MNGNGFHWMSSMGLSWSFIPAIFLCMEDYRVKKKLFQLIFVVLNG